MVTRDTVTAAQERASPGQGDAPIAITMIDGADAAARGRTWPLAGPVVIGRRGSDDAQLAFADPSVSRRHARLVIEGERVVVEDLGSHNGSFVDGVRGSRWELEPPFLLRVGDTLLEIARRAPSPEDDVEGALLGRSPAMARLREELRLLGPSRLPVLVVGETGTGKDLVARRLHEESGRAGPFVAVNVAAIPSTLFESTLFGHEKGAFTGADRRSPGCFERADGGTVLLDEIAELPLDLQPKLLRVLETRELARLGGDATLSVDVRVVAATNADLSAEVRAGTFRSDLYARLAGAVLRTPPLRERRADVPALARHFFGVSTEREPVWTAGFVEALVRYPWPRNVRELRSVIERLALVKDASLSRADLVGLLDDHGAASPSAASPAAPDRVELERLLRAHGGNVSRVARQLGKHGKQVYRWLAQHGLDPDDFRGTP